MANTCENHVGRLMEIRVADGYRSVRDVDRMIVMMQTHMSGLGPGDRYVIVADWRQVGMMGPDTAQRAREMLARANPRVIRSAILCSPDQSLANLQVVRLIREAEGAGRRHFTSVPELCTWLSEVLTEPERARLGQFLSITGNAPAERSADLARDKESPRGIDVKRGLDGARGLDSTRDLDSARGLEGNKPDRLRGSELPRHSERPNAARLSLRPSMPDPRRRNVPSGGSEP